MRALASNPGKQQFIADQLPSTQTDGGMTHLLEELQHALSNTYHVESEIGRGGMATVFLAEDLKHGRRVALKVLSPELSSSIDGDRFKREIQIAARLSHPHILPVFDSGEANGLLFYTMPFVEGESLRARLEREKQLGIDDALLITGEVADALAYAHGLGVIHRDIKPENILIHGGHAVVADFGIARVIQESGNEKLTQTGMSVGTAAYMSPEQFSGETVDGRSDMYSLACVLYELLVGEVPFTGPNAMAIMARHTMEMVPSIRIVRQTVPDEIEGAIMRALEKIPADRFASVADFKAALFAGPTGTSSNPYMRRTTRYAAVSAPVPRTNSRRRAMLIAAGVVAVAALTAGGLYARNRTAKRASVTGGADLRRLAVLYLDDQSRDSSLRHVADGLTESLIAQLGDVDGLQVAPASAVAAYRGRDLSPDSIARVLNVGTLVRGNIERNGKELHVAVELVDGSTGSDIQRAGFNVAEGQFLHARDSLAAAVAELLRSRLGDEVHLRELQGGTTSPEAWALVQRTERDMKSADESVAASKPDDAQHQLTSADSLAALAAQADAKWAQPVVETGRVAQRRAKLATDTKQVEAFIAAGLDAAKRALALDPRNADALELAGTLTYYRVQRGLITDNAAIKLAVDTAEKQLNDAVAVNPRLATAWNALSVVEYGKNDVPQAYLAANKAYEADSYLRAAPEILWRLYATSYDLEQFPNAEKWCDEGGRRFPQDPHFVQCRLYLMLSRAVDPNPGEAWRLVAELDTLVPKSDRALEHRTSEMLAAVVLGRANLADSAHKVIASARAGADVDPTGELIGTEALARTLLGERDQALQLLARYLTNHPDHRAGFAKVNSWWWRDLQSDPRFLRLVGTGR